MLFVFVQNVLMLVLKGLLVEAGNPDLRFSQVSSSGALFYSSLYTLIQRNRL